VNPRENRNNSLELSYLSSIVFLNNSFIMVSYIFSDVPIYFFLLRFLYLWFSWSIYYFLDFIRFFVRGLILLLNLFCLRHTSCSNLNTIWDVTAEFVYPVVGVGGSPSLEFKIRWKVSLFRLKASTVGYFCYYLWNLYLFLWLLVLTRTFKTVTS